MRRVTLRDIAKAAGVSHVTVSLALRNQAQIPTATRNRIRSLADKMGYVPDPALGRLNAYRRFASSESPGSALAWLNYWSRPSQLYSLDIYAQYWRGALERAAGLGYKLDEFRLADEGMSAARIAQILKARGIQGILIPPSEDGVLRKIEMPWENFATIRFGYSMPSIPTHLVSNTQFDTAREAVLRARALGAQRIGYYFHASGEQKTRNHFLGGYLVGRQGTGAIARIPPLMAKSPDKSAHRTEFLRWFRKHRPDCVLTQYGGAVSWILEEGKSIPGDVKVIHLSLPAKSEMILSGMSQNSLEIGKQAVELLARLLRNGETGLPAIPLELLVPGVWVQGDSA